MSKNIPDRKKKYIICDLYNVTNQVYGQISLLCSFLFCFGFILENSQGFLLTPFTGNTHIRLGGPDGTLGIKPEPTLSSYCCTVKLQFLVFPAEESKIKTVF